MTPALRQTWQVFLRGTRTLMRQPAYLLITVVQPVVWLLLFGAGWSGMAFVDDINNGVMDRMLTSPVWRGALNVGWVAYEAAVVMVQTVLIVILALLLGADFKGGVIGVILMFFVGALLASSVASLSNAVGVLGRQRETVIGTVSFFQLPLTFLSTGMMQRSLLPHWIQTAAKYNPVNWAVEAARAAAMQKTDWSIVGTRIGMLAGLAVFSAFVASRAFARYQRSL